MSRSVFTLVVSSVVTSVIGLSAAIAFAQSAPAAPTAPAAAPATAPATPAAAAPAVKAEAKPAAASSDNAMEGKVSYYGAKFKGRKTASGERFNPAAMTMAHKSLPFGTVVRVTNVKTKKSVVVRVNDRGPSTPDRIGDLSRAAAVKVGGIKAGYAEVTLTKVSAKRGGKAMKAKKAMKKGAKKPMKKAMKK
jgi:rare lipoprotein A